MLDSILYYLYQIIYLKGIKTFISLLILELIELIGWMDLIIHALLVLMILDFWFGFLQAYRDNKFSWERLKTGIIKFILYGIAIIVGSQTDIIAFHTTIEFGFRNFFIVYLGITESLSVIKHFSHFGLKFPSKLISALETFREWDISIPKKDS